MRKLMGFTCSIVALATVAIADSGTEVYHSVEALYGEVPPLGDDGSIAGVGGVNCAQPLANCQDFNTGGNAADFAFRSADDFRTPATGGGPGSVALSSICTWGLYFANSANNPFPGGDCFLVGIYADDSANGSSQVPGTLITELSQGCRGDGRISAVLRADSGVNSGTLDIYEYVLTIDADPGTPGDQPLMLDPNTCYWIEINNIDGAGASFQWAWSRYIPTVANPIGNSRRWQDINRNGVIDAPDASPRDLAFCMSFALQDSDTCVSATAGTNTTCATAIALPCDGGTVIGDNHYTSGEPAQNVASNPLHTCMINSLFVANPGAPAAPGGVNPLWYSFVAPAGGSVRVSTCTTAERRDTVATIYSGTCGNLTAVSCSDDACGAVLLQGDVVAHGLTPGSTYFLQVSGVAAGIDLGPIDIDLTCATAPPQPGNDLCANATALTIGAAPIVGTTVGATTDVAAQAASGAAGCTGGVPLPTPASGPGVWYSVVGDGNTLTASLCVGGNPLTDTIMNVFCGDCTALQCIGGDDDFCGPGSGSQLSWCSQNGVQYLILVTGFLESTGVHGVAVTTDSVACSTAIECRPTGACCHPDDTCTIEAEADCLTLGGEYGGDDSPCFTTGAPLTYSQTHTPGLAIPDNGFGTGNCAVSTITVPDSRTVGDVNVTLNISHTWVGDLHVTLAHSTGSAIIINGPGGGNCGTDNYVNIVLDDEGTGGSIQVACANNLTSPPSYLPAAALTAFDGLDSAGTWTLTLCDTFAADVGALNSWSITIEAATPVCAPTCPGDRGDANCDGSVDFFDIDPFLLALFNLGSYQATFCGGSICAADTDCSGGIDFFDIDPFLTCLFSGCANCP